MIHCFLPNFTFIYLSVCLCEYEGSRMFWCMYGGQRTIWEVGALLLPCGSQALNSGLPAWQQAYWPAKMSCVYFPFSLFENLLLVSPGHSIFCMHKAIALVQSTLLHLLFPFISASNKNYNSNFFLFIQSFHDISHILPSDPWSN